MLFQPEIYSSEFCYNIFLGGVDFDAPEITYRNNFVLDYFKDVMKMFIKL